MADYIVEGGIPLYGDVRISGAKNSALPILAATLLTKAEVVLHNCPDLTDVRATGKILSLFGCAVRREGDTVIVDSSHAAPCAVPEELMREMRSSIIFLGALLARFSSAYLSMPGGCELGPRPIDLHLSALTCMGATIENDHGYLSCRADRGLRGTKITLSFPSVGATENTILAAVTASGTTEIVNAACEPEIADLAGFLTACGARISGAGTSRVVIEGVNTLHGCEYSVMPDRIEAATFLSATVLTGGNVTLCGVRNEDMEAVLAAYGEMGCQLRRYPGRLTAVMKGRPKKISQITTCPYPGFPTDAQAVLMAAACVADGTCVFVENIFENRYKHVAGLLRMGADIRVIGKTAVVRGVNRLHAATVQSTDLRGGAALLTAALSAEGTATVTEIHHILRGYEQPENKLNALGARVRKNGSENKRKDTVC